MLLVQSLFSTFHTQRLWRLLDAPVYGEVPSAPGIWGEIYYRLHKLAKRWHAQVRQVEQQHSRFIQAIQASPNGVAMLDDHDQIEWCNAISETHFGLDAKRDLRQHITHLVRQPDFVRYLNSHHYEEMLIMRGMGDKPAARVVGAGVSLRRESQADAARRTSPSWNAPTRCGAISSPTCRTN